MNNPDQRPYVSIRDKKPFIHSSLDFIDALRMSVLSFAVSEQRYKQFEDDAVAFMSDINVMYEYVVQLEEQRPNAQTYIPRLVQAKNAVQEGLGELVASIKQGASYEPFMQEFNDWQQLWHEQLRA